MNEAFLTVAEFCATRKVSRSFAYVELKTGRLKGKKAGDRTIISTDAAKEWDAGLADYPTGKPDAPGDA